MDEEFSIFNDIDSGRTEEPEELTFYEKIKAKFGELKEDFLHLSLWQKLALIIVGSIFFTILFYALFTFTQLAHIQKASKASSNTSLNNTGSSNNQQGNTQGQNNQGSSGQTNITTPYQNTGSLGGSSLVNSQPAQATGSAGIVGFLQNLVGGKTNSSSQTSGSSSTNGTSGTSGTTSQTSQTSSQNVPQPYIVNFLNGLLYFQDPQTGQVTPYILSGVNPADFTWGRYVNNTDGYAIDYPTNWQLIKRTDGGHEGLSLYPPGEDANSSNAKQIGLGWSVRYVLPAAGGTDIYYQTSITVNNTLGQLYTLGGGAQGGKGVAVILPHRFGYFGLGGSADTDVFIYVFQQMLSSLTLTK